jgi:hypothetical protein
MVRSTRDLAERPVARRFWNLAMAACAAFLAAAVAPDDACGAPEHDLAPPLVDESDGGRCALKARAGDAAKSV